MVTGEGRGVAGGDRGVVLAVDGDGHRFRIKSTLTIGDVIGEGICFAFSQGQAFSGVCRIGERAVGILDDRARGAIGGLTLNCQGIAIGVGVVGQHIDDDGTGLADHGAIGHRHGAVVTAGDGDGHGFLRGTALSVQNRIGKGIVQRLPGAEGGDGGTVGGINRRVSNDRHRAQGALGDGAERQRAVFDIAVVQKRSHRHRCRRFHRRRVGDGCRGIVDRRHVDIDDRRIERPVGIRNPVGEAIGAVVVVLWRVGIGTVRVDDDRTVDGLPAGSERERQFVGVIVGIGCGKRAREFGVFRGGRRRISRYRNRDRRVVCAGNGDGDVLGDAERAIGNRVGEGVRALDPRAQRLESARGRRVFDRTVAIVDDGAVGWRADVGDAQRVSVDIRVVGEQVDSHRRCLACRGAEIVLGLRRVVDGTDVDRDRGGVVTRRRAHVVRHRIGERVLAVVVGVRRVEDRAVGRRRVDGLCHGGDGDQRFGDGDVGVVGVDGRQRAAGKGRGQGEVVGACSRFGLDDGAENNVIVDGLDRGVADCRDIGTGGIERHHGPVDFDGNRVAVGGRQRYRVDLRDDLDRTVPGGGNPFDIRRGQVSQVRPCVVAQNIDDNAGVFQNRRLAGLRIGIVADGIVPGDGNGRGRFTCGFEGDLF